MNDVNQNSAAAGIDPGGSQEIRNQQEQRVLTPVRQREDWPREAVGNQQLRRIAVLDTETTGLDWIRHKTIEICAAIVNVDANGRIAAIEGMGSGVEDPGHPLPPEIVELTGLTDAMVQGKEILREKLTAFIAGCEGVIAFNSGFDRPFAEALLPSLPLMPWGCAMVDVPWRRLGFEPGPQNYQLMQMGRFNADAHRARDDVLSLIELLDHVCRDGESVIAKVLAEWTARRGASKLPMRRITNENCSRTGDIAGVPKGAAASGTSMCARLISMRNCSGMSIPSARSRRSSNCP